jgi:hypothetical protein
VSTNPEIQCWAQVAATLGGQLQLRHIFKGPRQDRRRFGLPSLTVDIDGISVHGEVTGEGDPPATFAHLSVRVPGSTGLKVRVYRNYLYSQFGRVVGVQDLVLGDAHFDRNFVVKSNDPHYAKLWLSPSARKTMVAAPDYNFEIDGERATGNTHLADDPVQLEAALRAMAELARHGGELTYRVTRVAKLLGSEAVIDSSPWFEGTPPEFDFISGGRKVSLSIVHGSTGRRGQRRLLSRLWCRRLTARSDRFLFYSDHLPRKERPILATKLARCDLGSVHPPGYVVHASNPERLRNRMNEHWARTITRLAPLVLSCSEAAVEMVWPGAILQEQRLRDAAGLCEYFAVESRGVVSSGPYR